MKQTPQVYGLVLCGGKSTRMGEDKGALLYHGLPQQEYLFELLQQVCDRTFFSIREEQRPGLPEDADFILDKNRFRGPFNGLLSAYEKFLEVAWMVMACDLPLMTVDALSELLKSRDPEKMATAYATRKTGLPEPLAAIWEPEGLKTAIHYLNNGDSTCPRKFLINSDIKLFHPSSDDVLLNANSKEEYYEVLEKLNRS